MMTMDDDTLLGVVDTTAGLKKEGAIVVNSTKTPEEIRPLLNGYEGRIYTIDARTISMETLGKYFPNTPMLGAIVKVTGVMDEKAFMDDMVDSFKKKFSHKPQVVEGNIKALERSLQEVKGL